MDEGHAELLTDLLEDVVRVGTGKRAAIPGRQVAGKTGTTDNYGDAWFVGYTPELVVAVWVGYPDALRPMLTEFNGEPVAGGTLPAMIWKAFVEKTDEDASRSFDSPPYQGGASTWVVRRDGKWELDNGYCRGSRLVAYFSGEGPDEEADCKPNEVSVPLVVGMTKAGAEATLRAQPLEANVAYAPAKAGKIPGLVVSQDPRSRRALGAATRSRSGSRRPRTGCFRTSSAPASRTCSARLHALKVRLNAKTAPGTAGRGPPPEPGSRASPSPGACGSRSWSGTAHERRAGERVAPGPLDRPRDPDAGRGDDLDRPSRDGAARTAAARGRPRRARR